MPSNVTMVNLNQNKPTITVTPNPIEGKRLQLKAENMQKGKYTCMITDVLGKVLYQKEIFSNGTNEMFTLQLPVSTTKGVYYIEIMGGNGPFVYKFLVK
ncbi:MAG: T9SS type A sorting domain-containing protein [Chitinophagaceae bacterium]|nr:T9SS type A sorting domain-containing protein [Chitinophagaceae bacterium]